MEKTDKNNEVRAIIEKYTKNYTSMQGESSPRWAFRDDQRAFQNKKTGKGNFRQGTGLAKAQSYETARNIQRMGFGMQNR